MSKPTYLYRAVLTRDRAETVWDGDGEFVEVVPAGTVLGRRTGYLSRSGASRWLADDVEVIRSEPVLFLTSAEKLQKRIAELQSQLEALTS
jgi:hypothetical protein